MKVFSDSYSDVGTTITVPIMLKDGQPNVGNDYSFNVIFTNTAPIFLNSLPTDMVLALNEIK